MRQLAIMTGCCVAGGAIPALLMWMLSSRFTGRAFLQVFGHGCVFSFCIGFLSWAVMWRAHRLLCGLRPTVRALGSVVLMVALALAGSLLAVVILAALGEVRWEEYWPSYRYAIRIAIGITLVLGAGTSVVETLHARLEAARRELRSRQVAEERARHAATEARLSSLESRIHPHFLFNTLNSISALIREDPAAAERTVERLAALLRYSLDSNTHRLVPLRQELRVVSDYLEIERTRFGERLRYSIDIPAALEELDVPPLALQTLAENSIKHAVAANRQGGEIRIAGNLAGGQLRLTVADDGPGFDPAPLKPGHGLENLQERLAALYNGAGSMSISRREQYTVVEIAVPQKQVLV